jgi:hypothetical protein
MGRREAEEERQKAAGLVQQAYSGGYEHPIEVGGAVFTPLVLSPYDGWHGGLIAFGVQRTKRQLRTRTCTCDGDLRSRVWTYIFIYERPNQVIKINAYM